jgi:hypothetical protein
VGKETFFSLSSSLAMVSLSLVTSSRDFCSTLSFCCASFLNSPSSCSVVYVVVHHNKQHNVAWVMSKTTS